MRRLVILALASLLVGIPQAAAKTKPGPIDVYADFAAHGRLTKHYPASVLREIVNDASLNQYGDPLLMLRLRRAASLQLAGAPLVPLTATTGPGSQPRTGTTPGTSSGGSKQDRHRKPRGGGATTTSTKTASERSAAPRAASARSQPLFRTGAVVVGAILLVLAAVGLRLLSRRARRRP
jgi:hypothetical protein